MKQIILLPLLCAPALSNGAVVAPLVGAFSVQQPPTGYFAGSEVLIATISGQPGFAIHITEVGIGGDADFGSGPVRFSLSGAGIDVSWAAGQASFISAAGNPTILLPTTPDVGGSARGFSIQGVNYLGIEGDSINLRWDTRYDYDGRYTLGSDTEGNFYNDAATPSSIRAYVRYELVAVPEPSAGILVLASGSLLLVGSRRRHFTKSNRVPGSS